MKRILMVLALMLTVVGTASAEEAWVEVVRQAHPHAVIACESQWGPTAAAVLAESGTNCLVLVEQKEDGWKITTDNAAALPSGQVLVMMSSDCTLFWQYEERDWKYLCVANKQGEAWRIGSIQRTPKEIGEYTHPETLFIMMDGVMAYEETRRDANDNQVSQTALVPIPAPWLVDHMTLDTFEAARIRPMLQLTDWSERLHEIQPVLRSAAEALLPGYTFINGTFELDGLRLLMRRPSGEKVFVGVTARHDKNMSHQSPVVTISAPLPEETMLGYENETNALYCPGRFFVDVAPNQTANSQPGWHVALVMTQEGGHAGYLTENNLCEWPLYQSNERIAYGTHPWADIANIDWMTIPRSWDEIRAGMDLSGWAMVNNPNREDRLHLRAKPEKDAASLGKFYNGTPVRVLSRRDGWAEVEIGARMKGWMKTEYLAFAEEMLNVEPVYIDCYMKERETVVYDVPQRKKPEMDALAGGQAGILVSYEETGFLVIGVNGAEWSCVFQPDTQECWWVPNEAIRPGNG